MSDAVVLGGVDVFHLMNDRAMRARGLAGNHCAYVLMLDGRLDARALERRLARAIAWMPELRYRLEGGFPRLPRWRSAPDAAPPLTVLDQGERPLFATPRAFHPERPLVEERLEERVDGSSPWHLDLVRGKEHDTLVFRWFHSLADAKSAERLIAWIGSGDGDEPEPPPPEDERFASSERPIAKLDRDARMALMRAYNAHMMQLGRVPILSLANASRAKPPKRPLTHAMRVELSVEETRAFEHRVRTRARLAETSVMVWLVARMLDREMLARGYAPPRTCIPVPLSLDPKIGSQRMFGNHLSMMMFALDRDDLASEARAVASLADQQRAIVRQKLDLGMAAALDFARWTPGPVYRALSKHPFGGREMGSFVFSNPGAVGITRFAGVPVIDGLPLPAVIAPPGFQVIMSRFGGRLSALVGWVDGALERVRVDRMAEELRAEMVSG